VIVVQIAGFSESGKTEIALRIAGHAASIGPLAYVKSHHAQLERAGTNTARMADYASLRLLAGSDGTLRLGAREPLAQLLSEAKEVGCAVAIVEGFKRSAGAKAWLRRDAADAPPGDVPDVELDLLGSDALSMSPDALWGMLPRRTV
jgi:molybdopterin-guanine dinucleotide biosynthesis protein MobB